MQLILDTKTISPFGWDTDQSISERLELATQYADIIAVHTMLKWGGSFDLVRDIRKWNQSFILAKGIHRTDEEIKTLLDYGVDYVLVVGRIPAQKYIDKCMLEPTCLREMDGYPKNSKVVWNARNLVTGLPKKETFEEARERWDGWLCQASMIKSMADVNPKADAIMVGEHMEQIVKEWKG
jgi:indole-3-glycerol phosphate synthase